MPEQKLKRALLHIIDRFEAGILASAEDAPDSDPLNIAMAAGPQMAKRLAREPEMKEFRRQIKRGPESRQAVLGSAMSNLAAMFLAGSPITEDGGREAVRLFSFGLLDAVCPGQSDDGPALGEIYQGPSATAAREAIEAASSEQRGA